MAKPPEEALVNCRCRKTVVWHSEWSSPSRVGVHLRNATTSGSQRLLRGPMQRFYLGLGSTARVPAKCIRIASRFESLAQDRRIRQTLLPTFHSCLCVISTTVAERLSIGGFAFRILGLFSRKAMIKIEMVPLFLEKDVRGRPEREAVILGLTDGGTAFRKCSRMDKKKLRRHGNSRISSNLSSASFTSGSWIFQCHCCPIWWYWWMMKFYTTLSGTMETWP